MVNDRYPRSISDLSTYNSVEKCGASPGLVSDALMWTVVVPRSVVYVFSCGAIVTSVLRVTNDRGPRG